MQAANIQEAQRLRTLSIATKQEALDFVAAYRAWVDAISTYGNGLALKRNKPACVVYADIFSKANEAHIIAELCYWQKPFDHPANKSAGVPRATWERARLSRGLPTDEAAREAK